MSCEESVDFDYHPYKGSPLASFESRFSGSARGIFQRPQETVSSQLAGAREARDSRFV